MRDVQELINGLRILLESEDESCPTDDAIRLVAEALRRAGAVAEITEDDDAPDDMGSETGLWVVSSRVLVVNAQSVAEWTRCSVGGYGEMGRQGSEDEWCVREDTEGDDRLPETVAVALDAFGLSDVPPAVPEPEKASGFCAESSKGKYAVYWETVGDDERVVARYSDLEAAEAVCAQRNREFRARYPSSSTTAYLCGYGVRELVDDEWVSVDTE